jgi:ssRNA-specific RNase YbeY (16S rRNA maturation enzyme)
MPQVKIGPSYFQQAFKDYSNWCWAWAREIMQNCIDAPGCNKIDIVTTPSFEKEYIISVTNNGIPMTRDILENKFLSLGESGKRFEGSVGGFGKAKELIAFCHKAWTIRTGNLVCTGEGGDYQIIETKDYFHGTRTEVIIDESWVMDRLISWANKADWSGTLTINGEVIPTNFGAGKLRKEFNWGKVYTKGVCNGMSSHLIARVNGMPMFHQYINYPDGVIVIELTDSRILQSNRDNLVWEAQRELNKFIEDVSMSKSAAFKESKNVKKVIFKGYQLSGKYVKEGESNPVIMAAETKTNINATSEKAEKFLETIVPRQVDSDGYDSTSFRPRFFLRIEDEINVPLGCQPDNFSKNSLTLLNNWANILVELVTLLKGYQQFSVGFVFSDDARAAYEYDSNWGNILYVNPLKANKSINYWTKENYWELVSAAAHETVHMLGYDRHDEKYASKLITEVMAICLANRAKLQPKKLQEFK